MRVAARLKAFAPEIARAVQRVVDDWEQDEEGLSEEYGAGGICDDVAEAILDVVQGSGLAEEVVTYHWSDDNHTAVVARMSDGVYEVDVPLDVYETGSWYRYKKRPDVQVRADDVTVVRLGSLDEWSSYVEE